MIALVQASWRSGVPDGVDDEDLDHFACALLVLANLHIIETHVFCSRSALWPNPGISWMQQCKPDPASGLKGD